MASTNAIKFNAIALIICIALCAPLLSMATLTCCDLKPAFAACNSYVRNGGECVPQDCCFEAMNLKDSLITDHHDYVAACHCIQDAAVKIPDINRTAFSILPERCGIQLPFHFRLDMNCDRVGTDNETLLKSGSQRKAGEEEVSVLAGKDIKRRRLLGQRKVRASSIVIISHNSTTNSTTRSSSSRMNDHSFLMFHTCLVAIVWALIISLEWM